MLGKNLMWCARQHGHSVQIMLTMYGAWIEGSTEETSRRLRDRWKPAPQPKKSAAAGPLKYPKVPFPVPLKCHPQGAGDA